MSWLVSPFWLSLGSRCDPCFGFEGVRSVFLGRPEKNARGAYGVLGRFLQSSQLLPYLGDKAVRIIMIMEFRRLGLHHHKMCMFYSLISTFLLVYTS